MRLYAFVRCLFLCAGGMLVLWGGGGATVFGFGEEGHRGIYIKAMNLLRASGKDGNLCAVHWPANWERLRDASVIYPDCAVQYYDADILPKKMEHLQESLDWLREKMDMANALNSAEHYFDPRRDRRLLVFGPRVEVESCAKLAELGLSSGADQRLKLATLVALHYFSLENGWKCNVYGAPAGRVQIGADGLGFNAVSGVLFCLNGRAAGDGANPAGLMPTEGFIALASHCRPADDRDPWFTQALECLGVGAHYVEDLFSPGHTEWTSWCQSKALGFPEPDHEDFDRLGDSYFSDAATSRGWFYDAATLRRQRADLEEYLSKKGRPRCILSFDGATQPCTLPARANLRIGDRDWSTDLLAVLWAEAGESRRVWETRPAEKTATALAFTHRMESAVEVVAGVIDWSFSRAAPADGPYRRDATNFYGVAVASVSGKVPGAMLASKSLDGIRGSLGGIDQDDYFPVDGEPPQSVIVDVDEPRVEIGLSLMSVNRDDGQPTFLGQNLVKQTTDSDRRLEFDLGSGTARPTRFLIRVYSPNADLLHYTIRLGDPPASQPSPKPKPPTGNSLPLVYLAILLIGFSFILRPILGRNANGLILLALAMIGISLLFDLVRSGTFACMTVLLILALVIFLGRSGVRRLQGRR